MRRISFARITTILSLLLAPFHLATAQQPGTGTVTGTVTRAEGGALSSVSVSVRGSGE